MMMEHRPGQSFAEIGILQCCTPKFSPATTLKALLGQFQSLISIIHRHYHSLSPKTPTEQWENTKTQPHTCTTTPTLACPSAGPAPPPEPGIILGILNH